jgi:hypothetical protein
MKKKVTMTCILKSGVTVEDTIKIDKKNTRAFRVIDEMRKGIDNSLGYGKPAVQNITFGKLTVAVSEIAAIQFKEN